MPRKYPKRKRRVYKPRVNNLPDARPGETISQTIGRRGGLKTAQNPRHLMAAAIKGGQSRAKATRKPQTVAKILAARAANPVVDAIDDILARLNR